MKREGKGIYKYRKLHLQEKKKGSKQVCGRPLIWQLFKHKIQDRKWERLWRVNRYQIIEGLKWQIIEFLLYPLNDKNPLEGFLHCWWECKLLQTLWRTVWRFLKTQSHYTIQKSHSWAYFWREIRFERIHALQCSLHQPCTLKQP